MQVLVLLGQQESVSVGAKDSYRLCQDCGSAPQVSGAHFLTLKWSFRLFLGVRIGVRAATVSPLQKAAVLALNK